ncbi:MAG: amidohydrolase family [Trebouxia sp. A1-2]|nr:MAG: amidohydrolase family [Trebouxia sp. A1-2]
MGHGWEEAHWGGVPPSADWIDGISPVNPVLLYRMDVHMVLINTAALRLVGIDSNTEVPEGGKVVLGNGNEPTGILVDNAIALVMSHIPNLTLGGKMQALKAAVDHIVTKGVTTVCDMGSIGEVEEVWEALEQVYMPAADKGELPIRVFAMVPLTTWPRLHQLVKARGRAHPGGHLHWGGLKAFADGSLGSRTALMKEPYADDPTTRGIRLTPYSDMELLVQAADAVELQVAIHAIGDQANDDVLAMYSHAQRNNSHLASPRRHRIEHVQHVSGSDAMLAFSQLQTVAVVNPLHLLSDMHIMTDRLGRQRGSAEHAFAYNAMLKAGVQMAFASDWPVVPLDPLLGMYTAVHRRSPDSPASQAWHIEGAVLPEQAMMAHTKGAAFACGLEGSIGVIRPGMQADFTVLDGNLPDVLHRGLNELPKVKATYVKGQLQYVSAQAAPDLAGRT